MNDTAEKRSKFIDYEIEARKKKIKVISIGTAVLVVGIALFVWLANRDYTSPDGGNYNIGVEQNYKGKKIEMTNYTLTENQGQVKIPLDLLKSKKIIYMEYKGDGKKDYYNGLKYLPLTAFISPSGRVVWATSICEPCFSQKFYIEGQDLVCVACGTRWRLTDIFGESGGCVKYPPREFKYTVEGNNLVAQTDQFKKWRPREYSNEMQQQ